MNLFQVILDPINFKDVFEPNSRLIIRLLVYFHNTCADTNCLNIVFTEPFVPTVFPNTDPRSAPGQI
jgi:hypothetical protein